MKRPRIYGSESRCKTALVRYLRSADELLDQRVGVRNRIEGLVGPLAEFRVIGVESEWEEDVRRWFTAARRGMQKYLQRTVRGGATRVGCWAASGYWQAPPRITLEAAVPRPANFDELEASGLISEKTIRDYAKEMASPRTPRQLHHAIGAAKELTEATLRAALERLGSDYASRDDLPLLMKKWRAAVAELAPPDLKERQLLTPRYEAGFVTAHRAAGRQC